MRGFGGMLSFELRDAQRVDAMLAAFRLVLPALSLGGVESLVCIPSRTSHRKMSRGERERAGISDGLVRVSVGVEDFEDLLEDFTQALGGAGPVAEAETDLFTGIWPFACERLMDYVGPDVDNCMSKAASIVKDKHTLVRVWENGDCLHQPEGALVRLPRAHSLTPRMISTGIHICLVNALRMVNRASSRARRTKMGRQSTNLGKCLCVLLFQTFTQLTDGPLAVHIVRRKGLEEAEFRCRRRSFIKSQSKQLFEE